MLLALCRRRWAVPILGVLHRGEELSGWAGGAKFVTLCHTLGANQAAVRQSLDHLIGLGLVEPNSGYGHPLRPEYVLTRRGDRLAPSCAAVDALLVRRDMRELGLRRWSMPVVHAVDRLEPARFGAMAASLEGITDRALSLAVKGLCGAEVLDRRVIVEDFPPTTVYRLGAGGEALAPLLARL
jgi:DNA-binding HxlR family transcriptional regulator